MSQSPVSCEKLSADERFSISEYRMACRVTSLCCEGTACIMTGVVLDRSANLHCGTSMVQ